MKIIISFIFLFLPTLAVADCLEWGRNVQGGYVCMRDDLVNRSLIFPLTNSETFNSNASQLKCDNGETLVIFPDTNNILLMCASNLKPAHR